MNLFTRKAVLSLGVWLLALAWAQPAWAGLEVRGSDAFKDRVNGCLSQYRNAGGAFSQVVSDLEGSSRTHRIIDSSDAGDGSHDNHAQSSSVADGAARDVSWTVHNRRTGDDHTFTGTGRGATATVRVDADRTQPYHDGTPFNLCAVLLHELTHAQEVNNGVIDRRPDTDTGIRNAEIAASTVENQWRQRNGLPQRPSYGNTPLPASAFVDPLPDLEAQKARVEALVAQSNAALTAASVAAQAATASQAQAQTLFAGFSVQLPTGLPERAQALIDGVRPTIEAAGHQVDAMDALIAGVSEATNQVCDIVALIDPDQVDPALLDGAKTNLQRAEAAYAQVQAQENAVVDSVAAASGAVDAANQQLLALMDEHKQALTTILRDLDAKLAQLKALATQARQHADAATAGAAGVKAPASEARTLAPQVASYARRLAANTRAFSEATRQRLGALANEVAALPDGLHESEAGTHVAAAANAAAAVQGWVESAEQFIKGVNFVAPEGQRPNDLFNAVAQRAQGMLVLSALAAEAVEGARACLSRVSNETLTLTGQVVDKKTGDPIGGAAISVSGALSASAVTGGDGGYAVAGLKADQTIEVQAAAKGYRGQRASLKVQGPNPWAKFTLERLCEGEDAHCEATLAGTVVDQDTGQPIAGASVSAEGASGTTGAGGGFALTGLTLEQLVTLTASAKGYESRSRPVQLAQEQTSVTLALAPEIKSVHLTWRPADPGPSQGVEVTAFVLPRRANVTIRVRVVGTDGYHDDRTLTTNANGQVHVFVPGARKGVKDVLQAEVVGRNLEVRDGYVF